MYSLLNQVISSYVNCIPKAICGPEDSLFRVIDIPNYRHLRPSQLVNRLPITKVMNFLASGKVIIIRHSPDTEFDTFASALESVTQLDQSLEVQGVPLHYFSIIFSLI